ncbi:amino acid ABC transporter substrate-binding protein, PAAT family [Duganella sacchari]|uniref:Amino acid ABC transporter substrate-binding protein, PAAT family n=1 Tax=Duganella sacchari TaxID=551987 RepID=A0A1M7P7U4_9BURK|nr:transporter substrate-binding domain-containing protein [Duganella sacchari]SHN12798.1 amino acid ABC transporter substrate-binding protein, PAAT family [Duganella sacchari]
MRRNRLFLLASLWCSLPLAEAGGDCPSMTRVGFSDLGYTSYRENGRISGIAVDVVNELARRSGCKFEFHWYPRQRLFVELQAGRIDMAMGAFRTPERDAYARHLPYAYLQYDLILRDASGQSYASLSDFVERGTGRLNITRGLVYDSAIETQLARLATAGRLELVNDFETVFGKLEMGRADGTVATAAIYAKYLQHPRLKDSVTVIPIAEAAPRFTGIYVSKKNISPEVRLRYASALKTMVADQYVAGLYGRYIDEATIKRTFRLGAAPLQAALSTSD